MKHFKLARLVKLVAAISALAIILVMITALHFAELVLGNNIVTHACQILQILVADVLVMLLFAKQAHTIAAVIGKAAKPAQLMAANNAPAKEHVINIVVKIVQAVHSHHMFAQVANQITFLYKTNVCCKIKHAKVANTMTVHPRLASFVKN